MTPIIALYRGLYKELAWGKWFDLSYNFRGVTLSADGLIIVATTDNGSRFFVFRSADGNLINSQDFAVSSYYDQSLRNMLVSCESSRKIYFQGII
jgi:hypothetical protein